MFSKILPYSLSEGLQIAGSLALQKLSNSKVATVISAAAYTNAMTSAILKEFALPVDKRIVKASLIVGGVALGLYSMNLLTATAVIASFGKKVLMSKIRQRADVALQEEGLDRANILPGSSTTRSGKQYNKTGIPLSAQYSLDSKPAIDSDSEDSDSEPSAPASSSTSAASSSASSAVSSRASSSVSSMPRIDENEQLPRDPERHDLATDGLSMDDADDESDSAMPFNASSRPAASSLGASAVSAPTSNRKRKVDSSAPEERNDSSSASATAKKKQKAKAPSPDSAFPVPSSLKKGSEETSISPVSSRTRKRKLENQI